MDKANKVKRPNIVRGGIAIPLGRNYYYMAGRKHKNGGIDIGKNPRTGLEVEDGEVMHMGKNEVKVFSSVPFLNGKSPAQKVIGGENPNAVFKQQELFKDRNGINDDGTKKNTRTKAKMGTIDWNKVDEYADTAEKTLGAANLGLSAATLAAPNPYTAAGAYGTGLAGIITDVYQGVRSGIKGDWPSVGKNAVDIGLSLIGMRALKAAKKWNDLDKVKQAAGVQREYVTHTIGRRPKTRHKIKVAKERNAAEHNYMLGYGSIPMSTFLNFVDPTKPNNKNNTNDKKAMGGLSRSKDYGSKSKPYPSVKSGDFAGGHRSYPIPTKTDAVDALRLAGLHGRSDVRAKVYAKYPDLRKKSKSGGIYSVTVNGETKLKMFPSTGDIKLSKRKKLTGTAVMRNGGRRKAYMGINDNLVQENDATRTSISGVNERKRRTYYGRDTQNPFTDIISSINYASSTSDNPYLITGVAPNVGFKGLGFNMGRNAIRTTSRNATVINNTRRATATFNTTQRAKSVNRFNEEGAIGKNIENATKEYKVNNITGRNNPSDGIWNRGEVPEGSLSLTPNFRERLANIKSAIDKRIRNARINSANRRKNNYSTRNTTENTTENVTNNNRKKYIPFRKYNFTKESPNRYAVYDGGIALGLGAGIGGVGVVGGNLLHKSLTNDPLDANTRKALYTPVRVKNTKQNKTSNTSTKNTNTTKITNTNSIVNINNNTEAADTSNTDINNVSTRVIEKTNNKTNNKNNTNTTTSNDINNNDTTAPDYSNNTNPFTLTENTNNPVLERNNEPISSTNVPRAFARRNRDITDPEKLSIAYQKESGTYPNWFKRTYKNVKNYVNKHPETVIDGIGLSSNIIGGLISHKMNRDMLNKLKYNSEPIARKAAKLKTRININPQLDKMRETLAAYERNVDSNTASSRVALARKQRARLANMLSTNELYGSKENIETELINKDKLNQQSVADANIRDYNDWSEKKAAFNNAVLEKKGENDVSLINTINTGVQDVINREEKRKSEKQTRLAFMAANPNVNPRILKIMGIKGITDEDIEAYDKAYGKKKKGKKSSNNN